MPPIPVLFTTHYTGLGGGETALLTLAAHLDPARWLPHLLVPRDGQLAEHWRAKGWPSHILPFRGATTYFVPALWARLPISQRIERLIRQHGIRAVHSDYHALPMALPAAERAHVPLLWTCMGWWFRPKPWQRAFFRRSAATFAHSEAIRRGFLGDPPFMPPEHIRILYPGVDTGRFHPDVDGTRVRFQASVAQETPLVALVARFQSVKGHEVFQAVARQVALQLPAARFVVAGENVHGLGADDEYKRRILAAWEDDSILRRHITYLGFRDDVERVMAAADVVMCTSSFESFGVANVEAMACGKPVVSTNRGGPAETVAHEETGFLASPGDVATLAGHVITLLRDRGLRERMGRAGRARAERLFSARAAAVIFSEALERLVRE